jgi:hypothetical protein
MTLVLHETDVEIPGKNGRIITHAKMLTRTNGSCIGISFSPEQARTVLRDTNLFLPSEIDKWPFEVLVPPGTSECYRIPERAIFEGYTYKADAWQGPYARVIVDHYRVNDEREYPGFVWARNGELVEGPVENVEQAKL